MYLTKYLHVLAKPSTYKTKPQAIISKCPCDYGADCKSTGTIASGALRWRDSALARLRKQVLRTVDRGKSTLSDEVGESDTREAPVKRLDVPLRIPAM
jgi:hypothetical protein